MPLLSRFFLATLLFITSANSVFSQTWEIYDFQGKLTSRAIYDRVEVLSETVIVGKNQEGLFLLSPDLKPMVDLLGTEVYQYLAPWILVKGPNGIGAFHEYGQLAFPLEYEEVQPYFNYLLGRKGSNYFLFYRGSGKTTPLGSLEEAKINKNGVLITKKGGKYYLPLSKDPERAYQLLQENEGNYLLAKESTGFGLINIDGDYVMDPVIDQLEHTRGDYFYGFDEGQYLLVEGDYTQSDVAYNSYHKITKEGDLMLEYIHGKLRRVMEEDGILLDAVGIESVQVVGKELYNVRFRENKLGLLGKKGWLVQPVVEADWIKAGSEGLFPAGKNGLSGFVNSEGNWVIEPQFTEVGVFTESLAKYRNSQTWGLLAPDGRIISEPKWDEIKDYSSGKALAQAGDQFFILDNSGKAINSVGFDRICRLKEGLFLVEKDGKRGLLNSSAQEILPVEFENIQVEKPDFFIVRKEGKYGVLNEKGDVIFPINYQEIVPNWANSQVFVKELYVPVVIPVEEPNKGKRKKGA